MYQALGSTLGRSRRALPGGPHSRCSGSQSDPIRPPLSALHHATRSRLPPPYPGGYSRPGPLCSPVRRPHRLQRRAFRRTLGRHGLDRFHHSRVRAFFLFSFFGEEGDSMLTSALGQSLHPLLLHRGLLEEELGPGRGALRVSNLRTRLPCAPVCRNEGEEHRGGGYRR